MIETERLRLRPFKETDRDEFARINADPRVGDWLGGPIDRAASNTFLDAQRREHEDLGFGFWAAEQKGSGRLVGMIGIRHMPADLPPAPAIEAGWRLSADCWGQGLATEGAGAALQWAFDNLETDEIVAITAASNTRSQAVMRRLGMAEVPSRTFDHPRLPEGHPLRRHVVFAVRRSRYPS
jgi:RimJ/RimL family protein N-acetyltransferase